MVFPQKKTSEKLRKKVQFPLSALTTAVIVTCSSCLANAGIHDPMGMDFHGGGAPSFLQPNDQWHQFGQPQFGLPMEPTPSEAGIDNDMMFFHPNKNPVNPEDEEDEWAKHLESYRRQQAAAAGKNQAPKDAPQNIDESLHQAAPAAKLQTNHDTEAAVDDDHKDSEAERKAKEMAAILDKEAARVRAEEKADTKLLAELKRKAEAAAHEIKRLEDKLTKCENQSKTDYSTKDTVICKKDHYTDDNASEGQDDYTTNDQESTEQKTVNFNPGMSPHLSVMDKTPEGTKIVNFDHSSLQLFKVAGAYLDKGVNENNIVTDSDSREFLNVMGFRDVLVETLSNGENRYYGNLQFPLGSTQPAIIKSLKPGDSLAEGCRIDEMVVLTGFETEGVDYENGLIDPYLAHSITMPDGSTAFQETIRQPVFSLINVETKCIPREHFTKNRTEPFGDDTPLESLPVRD